MSFEIPLGLYTIFQKTFCLFFFLCEHLQLGAMSVTI